MAALDWIVVALYLGAMLGLSAWLGRGQRVVEDYYLGGRDLPAGAVALSTLATQSSAISFISIPAFVALRPDGGLRFLQYEIALPLAMAFVALVLAPALRGAGVVTVYEYLERRFDERVRRAVAGLFLLGRGLSTGVALYATGLVLSACLGTPLWQNLLLVGIVTVAYDLMGGMAGVVYSDVVQMVVLVLALGACIWVVSAELGGLAAALDAFPATRLRALSEPEGTSDSIAGYAVGGFFLYASYYGCDQSQAQRLLSTRSVGDSQRALVMNGFGRFPLVLAYCVLGVVAAGAVAQSDALAATLDQGPSDRLVPELVRSHLPSGLRGLVFAGLLAAAMSSLDSAVNSLSASTLHDFGPPGGAHDVARARWWTLGWGILITGFSFVVGDISRTVIEAINKVGSAVYGPVLAVFVLSLLPARPSATAVLWALAVGFGTNVLLWLGAPALHFMWWNAIGCGLAVLVATVVDRLLGSRRAGDDASVEPTGGESLPPRWILGLLGGTTLIIVGVMWLLQMATA